MAVPGGLKFAGHISFRQQPVVQVLSDGVALAAGGWVSRHVAEGLRSGRKEP